MVRLCVTVCEHMSKGVLLAVMPQPGCCVVRACLSHCPGVDGTTLKEAKYINLSLHYLEQVIIALQERSSGQAR